MRTILCQIKLPSNSPAAIARLVLVEAQDISVADAPSVTVGQQRLHDIPLKPNGQIECSIQVPETDPTRSLSMHAHISLDGSGTIKPGDLLATAAHPIPSTGQVAAMEIPVFVI